ncbi:MAG: ATP-binding cassette domain-containing protein, partial [Desulfobacterales bacterium]
MLFCSSAHCHVSESATADSDVAVSAEGLGVRYLAGSRREDVQSRIFNTVLKRRTGEYIWALKNVSLTLRRGEIIGVIGSNGAGKTTLCRVIAGQLRPDAGWINVNGRVTALLSIGTGFKKDLSGLDNIFLNAMMLGLSKNDVKTRLDEIVSFSGLGTFIDQPLKYYSSGMKSRLAFSIAATVEPEILVMDEALSTGDIEFSEKAGEKLQNLIKKAALAFMVTHNLSFVSRYCRRAIWIDKGSVRASGAPEDVISQYKDAYDLSRTRKKRPPRLEKTTAAVKDHPVIAAQKLGVRFFLTAGKARRRVLWALKDIDLEVREGEILGIIGANAAGKTTLCRALSGIIKPDAGSVRADGSITALLGF